MQFRYSLVQSNHVNINQIQSTKYIHGLCKYTHNPCKMPLGLISFCWSKIMTWIFDRLTSRLEKVENSYSLFENTCKHVPGIKRMTT